MHEQENCPIYWTIHYLNDEQMLIVNLICNFLTQLTCFLQFKLNLSVSPNVS